MIIHSTFLAAAAAITPAPPAPLPPTPPPAVAPAPPLPPAPPLDIDPQGHGARTVVTRNVDGHRVTVIARAGGGSSERPVLDYKDAQGRDVQVYADRPVSREEADRLLAEARSGDDRAREQGRLARDAGVGARVDAERIRREALESARKAMEASGLPPRDFADLRDVRVLRFGPGDGAQTWVDGRRTGPGFGDRAEVRELRDEVKALREELKALRAQLDRTPARR